MKQIPRTEQASAEDHARLVELIVRALDRTFSTGGHEQGLEALAGMLRSLDQRTLHALAYRLELDVEPPVEEEEKGRAGGR
jgi:hypothetical protein